MGINFSVLSGQIKNMKFNESFNFLILKMTLINDVEEQEIVWRGMPRRIAWSIISHMRIFLQVDIHPIISTSFMMIHNYYQSKPKKVHKLYILILTSVFTVCKKYETPRSMSFILSCLLNVCREFSKKIDIENLKKTVDLDDFTNRQITLQEITIVNYCELDLIEANNFELMIDLPFLYTTEIVKPNISMLPPEISKNIDDNLLKYLCIILCSEHCSDFHPEIMAVAASSFAFNGVEIEIPKPINDWMIEVAEKFGDQQIENAKMLLKAQYNVISQQR